MLISSLHFAVIFQDYYPFPIVELGKTLFREYMTQIPGLLILTILILQDHLTIPIFLCHRNDGLLKRTLKTFHAQFDLSFVVEKGLVWLLPDQAGLPCP